MVRRRWAPGLYRDSCVAVCVAVRVAVCATVWVAACVAVCVAVYVRGCNNCENRISRCEASLSTRSVFSCRCTGLFCRCVGLFGRHTGLFCGYTWFGVVMTERMAFQDVKASLSSRSVPWLIGWNTDPFFVVEWPREWMYICVYIIFKTLRHRSAPGQEKKGERERECARVCVWEKERTRVRARARSKVCEKCVREGARAKTRENESESESESQRENESARERECMCGREKERERGKG